MSEIQNIMQSLVNDFQSLTYVIEKQLETYNNRLDNIEAQVNDINVETDKNKKALKQAANMILSELQ